jgi:hypothetical protein
VNPFIFLVVLLKKGGTMLKLPSIFFSFLLFMTLKGYSQDQELKVYPRNNQTVEEQKQDEDQCASYADDQTKGGNHTTLKNSGIGAGIGIIGGKILGKPLAGAAIGGAAGAYRGHKKSKKERDAFDQTYASCLEDKGYGLDIQPKQGKKSNKNQNQYDQSRDNNNQYDQYDQGRNNNNQYDQYDRRKNDNNYNYQQYDQRRDDQYQDQDQPNQDRSY